MMNLSRRPPGIISMAADRPECAGRTKYGRRGGTGRDGQFLSGSTDSMLGRGLSPGAYSSIHTLSMDQNDPNGATSRFFTLLLNTEKMAGSWTKTMGAASTIFAWSSS